MRLPIEFLKNAKDKKRYLKILVILMVGLLLIVFGALNKESEANTLEVSRSEEERVADFCSSVVGVGECRVLITYQNLGDKYGKSERNEIVGIAVLCEGADKMSVKEKLIEILSSLYGIGTNRISVEKLKK